MTRVPALTLAPAIAAAAFMLLAAPSGAQAQQGQSYCLSGGGGLIGGCGFATLEQCRAAGAGFGICNPNSRPPTSAFARAPETPTGRPARHRVR